MDRGTVINTAQPWKGGKERARGGLGWPVHPPPPAGKQEPQKKQPTLRTPHVGHTVLVAVLHKHLQFVEAELQDP